VLKEKVYQVKICNGCKTSFPKS